MQVFKTFMKVAVRKLPSVIMYFAIFATIVFIMAANASSEADKGFESSKLKVCVTDLDDSEASRELIKFVEKNHTIVDMKTDDESVQDAMYYFSLDYALTINKGFEEKLAAGDTDGLFESRKRPSTYTSEFFDGQLTQYISSVSMYMAGGYEPADACKAAAEVSENGIDVTVETFDKKGGNNDVGYFTQYLSYIFICILVVGLGPILTKLNKKDIRRRMDCSSMPVSHKTLQIFAGTAVTVIAVWLAFMILAAAVYRGMLFTETGLLCMLNSAVFIIVAAGITLFVAQFDLNDNVVNMVSNVVSLGMAFLCGVFVPQNLLGEGVLAAAKFLPAYWFVRANNMLCGFSNEVYTLEKYLKYLGIEMLFAVALFSVVMVMSKAKMRSAE